jgi:hypothetical protein
MLLTALFLSTQIFGFASVWRESRKGVLIYAVAYGILELACDAYIFWAIQSDQYLGENFNKLKEQPVPFEKLSATAKMVGTASIALSLVILLVSLYFAYKYYKYLAYAEKSNASKV